MKICRYFSENCITLNFHQISIILMQTVILYYMVVIKKFYVLKIVTLEKEGGIKSIEFPVFNQLIFLMYLLLLFPLICMYT